MLTFTLIPRISEINSGGHVGNAVLPIWFEEARLQLLDEASQLTAADATSGWLVRHAAYEYEKELFYRGAVEIRSSVSKIGTTSITLHQEVWQNQLRAATATTTLVLVSLSGKSKLIISPASRAYLEKLIP
ncbi:MAG: thioesterase family protein [Verrucomicrobiaceae bacterium]|nr:thioesterase family protein [Verrucomicrobiaceae bacterium]